MLVLLETVATGLAVAAGSFPLAAAAGRFPLAVAAGRFPLAVAAGRFPLCPDLSGTLQQEGWVAMEEEGRVAE